MALFKIFNNIDSKTLNAETNKYEYNELPSTYKKGYMYGNNTDTINYISHYCAWTSTPRDPEGYYMIDIGHYQISKFVPMHKGNKVCARLVKDRK